MAGMVLLGSLFAPSNFGSASFFIFAAGFAGELAGSRIALRYLAALIGWIGALSLALRLPPPFWIPAIGLSAIIGLANIHFAQRRREQWKLKLAQEEIEQLAAVAERERIARDLHDLLGHTLSLIVIKSELASRLVEKDVGRAAAEIRDVERVSREALAQVREAVRGYRSSGIAGEARKARAALEAAGVKVECNIERVSLSAGQETVLALALREAATNIMRHAGATSCTIELRHGTGCVELNVSDNGRGGGSEGSGLVGMRERIESLGGSVERDALRGTTLSVRLPIEAKRASGVA
jgi:two-component system, NarL family, sensor histidine kinase DesK